MAADRRDPPLAREFREGQALIAVKEIDPKVPVGTLGEVLHVREDTNEIWIQWSPTTWPYVKVTKGSPSNGYEKLPRKEEQ